MLSRFHSLALRVEALFKKADIGFPMTIGCVYRSHSPSPPVYPCPIPDVRPRTKQSPGSITCPSPTLSIDGIEGRLDAEISKLVDAPSHSSPWRRRNSDGGDPSSEMTCEVPPPPFEKELHETRPVEAELLARGAGTRLDVAVEGEAGPLSRGSIRRSSIMSVEMEIDQTNQADEVKGEKKTMSSATLLPRRQREGGVRRRESIAVASTTGYALSSSSVSSSTSSSLAASATASRQSQRRRRDSVSGPLSKAAASTEPSPSMHGVPDAFTAKVANGNASPVNEKAASLGATTLRVSQVDETIELMVPSQAHDSAWKMRDSLGGDSPEDNTIQLPDFDCAFDGNDGERRAEAGQSVTVVSSSTSTIVASSAKVGQRRPSVASTVGRRSSIASVEMEIADEDDSIEESVAGRATAEPPAAERRGSTVSARDLSTDAPSNASRPEEDSLPGSSSRTGNDKTASMTTVSSSDVAPDRAEGDGSGDGSGDSGLVAAGRGESAGPAWATRPPRHSVGKSALIAPAATTAAAPSTFTDRHPDSHRRVSSSSALNRKPSEAQRRATLQTNMGTRRRRASSLATVADGPRLIADDARRGRDVPTESSGDSPADSGGDSSAESESAATKLRRRLSSIRVLMREGGGEQVDGEQERVETMLREKDSGDGVVQENEAYVRREEEEYEDDDEEEEAAPLNMGLQVGSWLFFGRKLSLGTAFACVVLWDGWTVTFGSVRVLLDQWIT